jgi:hypothetical protein
MTGRQPGIAAGLLLGLLSATTAAYAASPAILSGALAGSVKDASGVPQMGATVLLFNRYDKLIQKAFTNAKGDFQFASILPDVYSVRVTLASFVPAFRKNIAVQPGMRSILAINLANVLSSIELVSTGPSSGPLMSDDWKSVLQSSMATRSIMRAIPDLDAEVSESRHAGGAFTETTGVLKVSSGETAPYAAVNNQPDLGTYFALATSLYGKTKLQFSGNFGYAMNSALPAAGFRTSVSRGDMGGPELKITMQQLALPSHGMLMGTQQDSAPVMRTLSATLVDHIQILDNVDIDYGTTFESVTFLDRLNFLSPFARVNYRMGSVGTASVAYSSGAPPVDLWATGTGEASSSSLEQDMSALSMFPRVSLRDGATHVQRTDSSEIGYAVTRGSRTYGAAVYRESIANAALTMTAPAGMYADGDLLPELSSRSSVFNIGNFERTGYMAYVTQSFADRVSATLSYGRGGSLRTESRELATDDPEELRASIHPKQQQWVNGKIAAVLPFVGTRISANYQWMDYRSLTPNHVYLTQRLYAEPGLNFRIRQPIPSIPGIPGRLEASAELRNLLAQGYLSMTGSDGRKILLTNAPRAVRGGVAFIF